MKRRFLALFAALLLLPGCAPEVPVSNISITAASAPMDFGSFTASVPDQPDAEAAEGLVRDVLEEYPAGFPEQWGSVEFLLVSELTGEEKFSLGSYAGFTQRNSEGWQIVLDVTACDSGTVHHEIAHVLDGILTQAGALTEAQWLAFCPGGFSYGQTDFDTYPDFFADAYAMENMKEDRARTFEDAILYGEGIFDGRPALWLKLEYLSRAIRSHFDTTGWPEKTIWELGLE